MSYDNLGLPGSSQNTRIAMGRDPFATNKNKTYSNTNTFKSVVVDSNVKIVNLYF